MLVGLSSRALFVALLLACTLAAPLAAVQQPDRDSVIAEKEYRHPDLYFKNAYQPLLRLPAEAASLAEQDLSELGLVSESAFLDRRGGGWGTLLAATPLIPGDGVGNSLSWGDLGLAADPGHRDIERAAWQAFTGFLTRHEAALRISVDELSPQSRVVSHEGGALVQIHAPRVVAGIPVRDSYLTAVINHGNLVLYGAVNWGSVRISPEAALTHEDALATAREFLRPLEVTGTWQKPELLLIPMANGHDLNSMEVGRGYSHRLAWIVRPTLGRDTGARWEALVDAHGGDVLAFEDTIHYATTRATLGGVLPVSNDGTPPDGVEQAGWPMPFENVSNAGNTLTTDSGGNLPICVDGNISSSLSGPFVNMNDNCGSISLTSAGDLDFGASGGTDCVTPGFGGAGNTHASRSGFYELNRIKELARSQLPNNAWLNETLTANMNINLNCNATWNGVAVNFYTSGGGCGNTGELAGVFDHEWGHGMDNNDVNPSIANPGEGIADIYAYLRLDTSCIGRGFLGGSNCGGYGDPCLNCDGVRDIDFAKRASGNPHDVAWADANCGSGGSTPCGGSTHCEGSVYAESLYDMINRDLPSLFGMDHNTALQVGTRINYLGAGPVGNWFQCSTPFGGCNADGGYLNYLAADDDDGNLANGTPHMTAIFAAFDRHGAACNTPTVQNGGCAGAPTVAPAVTATARDRGVELSWGAVAGATEYQIFRTDGVFACDFGKVKVGTTTGTSFTDGGLQNGREYYYIVIPVGSNDTCMGPASSCTTVTPAAGPNFSVDSGSIAVSIAGGDGDQFLDNCETGTVTFDVSNIGTGSQTNVRIDSVSSSSHPLLTFSAFSVAPGTLAACDSGVASFNVLAAGLTFGDTVELQVELTSDQLAPATVGTTVTIENVESDFQTFASRTFDFEADNDGWSVIQGTFNRTSAGGGGNGTAFYQASSDNLAGQCDQIQSPVLSLSATSTMTLWTQFDIEPAFNGVTFYDRANIGRTDVATGVRTLVSPNSGRAYNASGSQGTCGTTGQAGWADAATAWASSTWNAAALGSASVAGDPIRLSMFYGTDGLLQGFGMHFDEVTLTNFDMQVPDSQSDSCGCSIDADCDDGTFCNGAETCNAGTCQAGTPVDCDDGVDCTNDACNEGTDSCDNAPDDAFCGNGIFCDGAEICNVVSGCQAGGDPCPGQLCDEGSGSCVACLLDVDCDDGLFCNGAETCLGGACQAGSDPCPGQGCDEGTDTCVAGSTPQLESGSVTVGATDVTVTLAQSYVSPVVVATAQYDNNTTPIVTRVSNVTSNSFDVRLQNPSGGTPAAENVSYLVVEEGTWTIDGVNIEAQLYTSTVTDENNSWVGQAQTYGQSYTNPVVLGQVMSDNDAGFSVFWDQGTARTNPPISSSLTTGKTVCEDTNVTRVDETVGFIVVEAGHGTIGGVEFEAALGADTVLGVTNAPPYAYTFNTAFTSTPTVAVMTMAGVDGVNGGWAQGHGATLANTTTLFLSIDEDQIGDTERSHTSEQVGYFVFEGPAVFPPVAECSIDADCDDGLFCNGAETCNSGSCEAGSDPCPGQTCDEVGDVCVANPVLEWGSATVGSTSTTVNLTGTYTSPVVVTAVQYDNNTIPVVTRISNVTGSSFDIRLQAAAAGTPVADNVSYLVVEEGAHTVGGVALEAQTYTSTVTDENNSWVGQAQAYAQSYTNPVVLGQVMSSNDADWSVFWDQGTARNNPPSAGALTTGKTVAEDTNTTRANETVGFVVFEAGHGTLGGVEFEAALGADTVAGVTNSPPYAYTFNTAFASAPSVAITTMAGVDGGNGGWAQVHGATIANPTTLFLSIDEDTIGDTERAHTTEQVGYVVFAAPGSAQ